MQARTVAILAVLLALAVVVPTSIVLYNHTATATMPATFAGKGRGMQGQDGGQGQGGGMGAGAAGTGNVSMAQLMAELQKIMPYISPKSKKCVMCHLRVTPGIVAAWLASRHAHITVWQAWEKPALEKEISSLPPENMWNYVVGCYECHGLNPDMHPDTFNHFYERVHVIVTPNDCKVCHKVEVEEYEQSTMANAYYNLVKNPIYMMLVKDSNTVNATGIVAGGKVAELSSCFKCHGDVVTVDGTVTVTITTRQGPMTVTVPRLKGWPNHGCGRVNPDGSMGACEACHPAHEFSIAVARSPYTCSQCHEEPDVPGFETWKENKMGNIWMAQYKHYNLTHVPWVVGVDFKAPSCAVCHMSLIVSPQGTVIANRTHNVDARLYIRLFGIYACPPPKNGATWKIRNADGQPLPYTLTGKCAGTEYLISPQEQAKRKEELMKICEACHSTGFVMNHFKELDEVVNETNKAILATTKLLLTAYNKGLANPNNLFDEHIERMWVKSWLFYANSIRYGTAMAGPDYTTFKLGWYQLTDLVYKMKDYLQFLEKIKG